MEKYEGETDRQAMERPARIMDSELCHLADHAVSVQEIAPGADIHVPDLRQAGTSGTFSPGSKTHEKGN